MLFEDYLTLGGVLFRKPSWLGWLFLRKPKVLQFHTALKWIYSEDHVKTSWVILFYLILLVFLVFSLKFIISPALPGCKIVMTRFFLVLRKKFVKNIKKFNLLKNFSSLPVDFMISNMDFFHFVKKNEKKSHNHNHTKNLWSYFLKILKI